MNNEFDGLYKVQKKDIVKCGRILTDAFKKDPKWAKLFDNVGEKQQNAFYQEPTSYCIHYGQVLAPTEDIEGVMAIVPGKYATMTGFGIFRTLRLSIILTGGIPLLKFLGTLDSTFDPLEEYRNKKMQGRDYLYIFIIGVSQDMQGRGFGGKMLKAVCRYADNQNLPIYLETATEKNVNMYQKYGFTILDKIMHPDNNLPQWAMIREVN